MLMEHEMPVLFHDRVLAGGASTSEIEIITGGTSGAFSMVNNAEMKELQGVALPGEMYGESVPMRRLDELWLEMELASTPIDVLKISVGRTEPEVVQGTSELLRSRLIRRLVINVARNFKTRDTRVLWYSRLLEPLERANYSLWFSKKRMWTIDDIYRSSLKGSGDLIAVAPEVF